MDQNQVEHANMQLYFDDKHPTAASNHSNIRSAGGFVHRPSLIPSRRPPKSFYFCACVRGVEADPDLYR